MKTFIFCPNHYLHISKISTGILKANENYIFPLKNEQFFLRLYAGFYKQINDLQLNFNDLKYFYANNEGILKNK